MSDQQSIFDDPLMRAREFKAMGRFESAHELLTKALAQSRDDQRLKASLADLYYRWGKYRKALSIAGQLLAQNSEDHRALVVIGNTLLAKKKPDEALEYFKLATDIAPTDYIWGRIAKCHIEKKRPQAALDALNRAEQLTQASPRLLGLRAECFAMLGEQQAQRQELLRAARLAPSDGEDFFKAVWPILGNLTPRQAASVSKSFRDECEQAQNPHLLLFETESLMKCKDVPGAKDRIRQLRSLDAGDTIQKAIDALNDRIGKLEKSLYIHKEEAP